MSLAFDENGRPFIILREQEKKKRVKGLEAHKVSSPLFLEHAHTFTLLSPRTKTFAPQGKFPESMSAIGVSSVARSFPPSL